MSYFTEAREHLISRIAAAEVIKEPWPHCRVSEAFPPSFYQMMLENFPSQDLMLAPLQQKDRSVLWLRQHDQWPKVPWFWDDFRHAIFPQLKFALEQKLGVNGEFYGGELVFDRPGYSILPHTDSPHRRITSVWYLPRSTANSAQGTVLLKGKPDGSGINQPWENFEPAGTVPYMPNTGFFFQRSDVSFHGVRHTPVERRSFAFDVFWKKKWK